MIMEQDDVRCILAQRMCNDMLVTDIYSIQATFEEHLKGQIQPGMLADFVVLSDSPFRVPANKISAIQVEKAFLGGACVYER